MPWESHYTYELITWMKFAVRSTLISIGLIFLLALLIISGQFTYRLVEWLSATVFDSPWA